MKSEISEKGRPEKKKRENDFKKSELMIMILVEIAENSSVDRNTIMNKFNLDRLKYSRYMRDLSRIVPIYYDNKTKRYNLNALENNNRILRTPPEFYAFMLMLQAMARTHDGRQNQVSALLSKYHVISNTVKESTDTYFQFIESGKSMERLPKNIYEIYRAILANRTIEFDYQALEKEIRSTVNPYKIVFDRHWYLYGYSHYSNGNRLYRISRMSIIKELKTKFDRPEELPRINSVSNSWDFQTDPDNPAPETEVEIEFDPCMKRTLTEEFFHPSQKIKELPDGRILFTVTVKNTSKLIKWILSFENKARIKSPDSLINEFQKKLNEIRELYTREKPRDV